MRDALRLRNARRSATSGLNLTARLAESVAKRAIKDLFVRPHKRSKAPLRHRFATSRETINKLPESEWLCTLLNRFFESLISSQCQCGLPLAAFNDRPCQRHLVTRALQWARRDVSRTLIKNHFTRIMLDQQNLLLKWLVERLNVKQHITTFNGPLRDVNCSSNDLSVSFSSYDINVMKQQLRLRSTADAHMQQRLSSSADELRHCMEISFGIHDDDRRTSDSTPKVSRFMRHDPK